jgi:hypothetical protein
MAEQQTTPTSEPVVATAVVPTVSESDEEVVVQTVDDSDEVMEQAPAGQDAAPTPGQEAGATPPETPPAIPPAIQAELDKLREENRHIQSIKDKEVAAAQAALYQEQKKWAQQQQQIQQWQQERAQAEAEAQRIQQEEEFKQWWGTATPEQQAAYTAAQSFVSNVEQQKRQQADALATQAVQQEGIPPDWLEQQLQEDYSPTAVKAAVLLYRQWRTARDREIQARLAPIRGKIAEAQRVRMMSPEQRADYIARMEPGRAKDVLARMQKRGVPVGAPAPAPVPVAKVAPTAPPIAPQAPLPPIVTPGSTSGTPPSNLVAELDKAIRSNNRNRIVELRAAMGRASGVDQTLD